MVSDHPTKSGCHMHCGSGVLFQVSHVILQDHAIKRSFDLMGGTSH